MWKKCEIMLKSANKICICQKKMYFRTLPWVEHVLALRRSCLPCTTLPYSHTAAYPQGIRHSMCRAYSSEWGLFGRNTRSAFRRTPSRSMQPILSLHSQFLSYFECTPRKRVPPRSYIRAMQPILQSLTLFIRKSASPYCTTLILTIMSKLT